MTHTQTQGADGAGTKTAGEALWRCPECDCHSYARVDQKQPNGGYAPGPLIRCVNCKDVFHAPVASAPAATPGVPDSVRALSEAAFPGPWRDEDEQISGSTAHVEEPWNGGDIICDMPSEGEDSRRHWPANRAFIVAAVNHVRALISAQPAGQSEDETERCIACDRPLRAGERVLSDASGGTIHATCCGPERESYTGADSEPLGPNDPIPQGYVYEPDHPAGQSAGTGAVERSVEQRAQDSATTSAHHNKPAPNSTRTGAAETGEAVEAAASEREVLRKAVSNALHDNQFLDGWPEMVDPVVEAILAARPEAPSDAGKGRPIDTAPKDRSKILLFGSFKGSGAKPTWFVGAWFPCGSYGHGWWVSSCVEVIATAWAPLPTPPSDPAPSGQAEG